MTQPVTPAEAIAAQQTQIPDVIFDTVNALLVQRSGSSRITITQKEVIAQLGAAGMDAETIYKNSMLDFEAAYEASGWQVVYEKPAYNEPFAPYWVFTR